MVFHSGTPHRVARFARPLAYDPFERPAELDGLCAQAVERGDTLWSIATATLDGALATDAFRRNRLVARRAVRLDPDAIRRAYLFDSWIQFQRFTPGGRTFAYHVAYVDLAAFRALHPELDATVRPADPAVGFVGDLVFVPDVLDFMTRRWARVLEAHFPGVLPAHPQEVLAAAAL